MDAFEGVDGLDGAGVGVIVVDEFGLGAEESVVFLPVGDDFFFGGGGEPVVELFDELAGDVDAGCRATELSQGDGGVFDGWVVVGFGLQAVDADADDDGVVGVFDEDACDFFASPPHCCQDVVGPFDFYGGVWGEVLDGVEGCQACSGGEVWGVEVEEGLA